MRNATVVVAVLAVVVMVAGTAQADTAWTAGDSSWHTGTNWDNGLPAAGVTTIVDNSGTANISADAAAGTLWIGHNGTDGNGTVSQSAGNAVFSIIGITDASSEFGRYEISGGTLNSGSHLLVGSGNGGDGRFKVTGSGASSISATHFNVYTGATWEIVLDASGVTKVVADDNYNEWVSGYFSGTLTLDEGTFVKNPAGGTIDILECTSALYSYANLTFSASGWSLTHTGVADGSGSGTLQLTYVPEPATMVLLGIGGIGVLLRRKRQ